MADYVKLMTVHAWLQWQAGPRKGANLGMTDAPADWGEDATQAPSSELPRPLSRSPVLGFLRDVGALYQLESAVIHGADSGVGRRVLGGTVNLAVYFLDSHFGAPVAAKDALRSSMNREVESGSNGTVIARLVRTAGCASSNRLYLRQTSNNRRRLALSRATVSLRAASCFSAPAWRKSPLTTVRGRYWKDLRSWKSAGWPSLPGSRKARSDGRNTVGPWLCGGNARRHEVYRPWHGIRRAGGRKRRAGGPCLSWESAPEQGNGNGAARGGREETGKSRSPSAAITEFPPLVVSAHEAIRVAAPDALGRPAKTRFQRIAADEKLFVRIVREPFTLFGTGAGS